MAPTEVVRVPGDVLREARSVAALRGQQPGEALAEAWREYLETHRDQFAEDLETAAKLMRGGTLEQLGAFASRNSKADAAAAVKRLKSDG